MLTNITISLVNMNETTARMQPKWMLQLESPNGIKHTVKNVHFKSLYQLVDSGMVALRGEAKSYIDGLDKKLAAQSIQQQKEKPLTAISRNDFYFRSPKSRFDPTIRKRLKYGYSLKQTETRCWGAVVDFSKLKLKSGNPNANYRWVLYKRRHLISNRFVNLRWFGQSFKSPRFHIGGCTQIRREAIENKQAKLQNAIQLGVDSKCLDYPLKRAMRLNLAKEEAWLRKLIADEDLLDEVEQDVPEVNERISAEGLVMASRDGSLDAVRLQIMQGVNVNAFSHRSKALIEAARQKHWKIVKMLIETGADVNTIDDNHNTPLLAAVGSESLEIVEMLIAAGASLSSKNKDGTTAITTASRLSSPAILKALVQAGADVIQSVDGKQAIIHAAKEGRLENVKILIEAGANVDVQDIDQNSPLIYASIGGHVAVIECLIKANANVDGQNSFKKTALIKAAELLRLESVESILQHAKGNKQFNIDLKDIDGNSALVAAANKGSMEIVSALIRSGANVDLKGKEGCTALFFAAGRLYYDATKTLIGAGANVNLRNDKGATVLAYVNNTAIVNLLSSRGAELAYEKESAWWSYAKTGGEYVATHSPRVLLTLPLLV